MTQLFGRKWRLVTYEPGLAQRRLDAAADLAEGPVQGNAADRGIEVTALRVAFKVERKHGPEPGNASIEVYNLSPASRAMLSGSVERGLKASLEAGYAGARPLIFDGKIAKVWHRRSGPDWISHLEADDGAAELARGRIQQSFAAGATLADVFKGVSQHLGVGVGNALEQFKSGNFQRGMDAFVEGVVVQGTSKDVLNRLMEAAGLECSVQGGQLVVTRPGEPLPTQAVVLSRDTGLIGSPEPGEKGLLRAKALIRPGLEPPRKVDLQAATVSGIYRIDRVLYGGDSHGGDWYAELDLRRVD